MCFFTWDHRTSLVFYSSSKATVFPIKLWRILSARMSFVQSLPAKNCTGSGRTGQRWSVLWENHPSSCVKNPQEQFWSLGISWSPPVPGRAQCNLQILAPPLIPSCGCPSAPGSLVWQTGISEPAKEDKRETSPEEHGGMIHRHRVPVRHHLSQVTLMSPIFSMGFYAFSPPPNRRSKKWPVQDKINQLSNYFCKARLLLWRCKALALAVSWHISSVLACLHPLWVYFCH